MIRLLARPDKFDQGEERQASQQRPPTRPCFTQIVTERHSDAYRVGKTASVPYTRQKRQCTLPRTPGSYPPGLSTPVLKFLRQQQRANAVEVYFVARANAPSVCLGASVVAPEKSSVESPSQYPRPPPGILPRTKRAG